MGTTPENGMPSELLHSPSISKQLSVLAPAEECMAEDMDCMSVATASSNASKRIGNSPLSTQLNLQIAPTGGVNGSPSPTSPPVRKSLPGTAVGASRFAAEPPGQLSPAEQLHKVVKRLRVNSASFSTSNSDPPCNSPHVSSPDRYSLAHRPRRPSAELPHSPASAVGARLGQSYGFTYSDSWRADGLQNPHNSTPLNGGGAFHVTFLSSHATRLPPHHSLSQAKLGGSDSNSRCMSPLERTRAEALPFFGQSSSRLSGGENSALIDRALMDPNGTGPSSRPASGPATSDPHGTRRALSGLSACSYEALWVGQEGEGEAVFNLTGRMGTSVYRAPETVNMELYNEKVDVFSFGMMLYELWSRSRLLHQRTREEVEDMCHKISQGYRPRKPDGLSSAAWHLVQRCWAQDPVMRPTMSQVVTELVALQQVSRHRGASDTQGSLMPILAASSKPATPHSPAAGAAALPDASPSMQTPAGTALATSPSGQGAVVLDPPVQPRCGMCGCVIS